MNKFFFDLFTNEKSYFGMEQTVKLHQSPKALNNISIWSCSDCILKGHHESHINTGFYSWSQTLIFVRSKWGRKDG